MQVYVNYIVIYAFWSLPQNFFQYRIEADGEKSWGGIWEAPRDYTFLSTSDKQTDVKLLEKFDSWNEKCSLAYRMPRLDLSPDIFLTSASLLSDPSGSIIYNNGVYQASYLKEKNNPGVVRYWMREGTRYWLRSGRDGQIYIVCIWVICWSTKRKK